MQTGVALAEADWVAVGELEEVKVGVCVGSDVCEAVAELDDEAVIEDDAVCVGVCDTSGTSQQAPRSVTQQGTSSSAPSDVTCTHAEAAAGLSPLGSFVLHSVAPSLRMNDASDARASAEYGAPHPQPEDLLRAATDGVVADSASHTPQPSSTTVDEGALAPQLLRTTAAASLALRTRAGVPSGDRFAHAAAASANVMPPLSTAPGTSDAGAAR